MPPFAFSPRRWGRPQALLQSEHTIQAWLTSEFRSWSLLVQRWADDPRQTKSEKIPEGFA